MPVTSTDTLSASSLDWALKHINHFGDTDIFPRPFEYAALQNDWVGFRDYLQRIDLSTYHTQSYIRGLLPKPIGGYRVVHQLDPIDTLLYTAMIYENANQIEATRASPEIACSYRVCPDTEGKFFDPANTWRTQFHKNSDEYSRSGEFRYVVLADIADFYNQISQHRLTNNLEIAGVSSLRAGNIERFLFALTEGLCSRGVPVGPSASILLAEASLIDVDQYLINIGCTHVRYVDDFRIFCHTAREGLNILHDLTEYLYTTHRLSLQSNKTCHLPIEEFRAKELFDPETAATQAKADRVKELLEQIQIETGYAINEDDLDPDDLHKLTLESLSVLFDSLLATKPLQLGLAKYTLRRAKAMRTTLILQRVLENLDYFTPVFRDIILYILEVAKPNNYEQICPYLMEFINESDISFNPFIRMWIIDVLTKKPEIANQREVFHIANNTNSPCRLRFNAQVARAFQDATWVRANRENWQGHSPWESRAIIWSSKVFGADERNHWLNGVLKPQYDVLTQAVARAVLNGL